MKRMCVAVALFVLSGCGYNKDGASWGQIWDDYATCHKQAEKQKKALENQCMAKLGYSVPAIQK